MKFNKLAVCLMILSVFLTSGIQVKISGQDESKPNPEQTASDLIDEILLETPMIQSKENRITIYTLMTDLLWSRDEKRARQVAAEAAELLRAELVSAENSRSSIFPPISYGDLRNDFIVILVRRDLAFAQEMKIYTLPLMPKLPPVGESEKNQLRNWQYNERDLEQKMAFQTAAKNPSEARKMAGKSLAQGVTDDSLNTLRRLQIKNSVTANGFADELIDKLIAANFSEFNYREAEAATDFLFQMNEKQGVFAMPRSCNCPAKPLELNPQKINRLASKWFDFNIKKGGENSNYNFLELLPVLQKLLPERKTELQTRLDAIKKVDPNKIENADLKERVFDDKTTPEMLAAMAVKKEGNEKFRLYQEAFIKAANNSKAALEKLLPVVSEHPESDEKSWILDQINANLAGKTAEEGNLEKALEMSQKIVAKDRRIGLLSFLALEFLESGNKEKAKQLTDEIALLIDLKNKDKLPKAIVGYSVLPGLFHLFAMTDPERAFVLLENTVLPDSNNLLSGRFRMNGGNQNNFRDLLNGYSYVLDKNQKSFKNLIDFDYERAKNLPKYLNNPEFSLMAKVFIVQSLTAADLGFGFIRDRDEMIVLKN